MTFDALMLRHGLGQVEVDSSGILGSVLARWAGVRKSGVGLVEFQVKEKPGGVIWCRTYYFDAARPRRRDTRVYETHEGFDEKIGPLTLCFTLAGRRQARLRSLHFLGVRVPAAAGFRSTVNATTTDSGLLVEVAIRLLNGTLGTLNYTVQLTPQESQ